MIPSLINDQIITFFFVVEHRFSFPRDSDGVGFHAWITESVNVFRSNTEAITLTRNHGISFDRRYRMTQRMTTFSDDRPRAFTGVSRFHAVADHRAASVVSWRSPNDRCPACAGNHARFVPKWLRWT